MYSVLYVSKLKFCLNSELELKLNFDSKWAKLDQYCDNIGKIEQVNQRLKARFVQYCTECGINIGNPLKMYL